MVFGGQRPIQLGLTCQSRLKVGVEGQETRGHADRALRCRRGNFSRDRGGSDRDRGRRKRIQGPRGGNHNPAECVIGQIVPRAEKPHCDAGRLRANASTRIGGRLQCGTVRFLQIRISLTSPLDKILPRPPAARSRRPQSLFSALDKQDPKRPPRRPLRRPLPRFPNTCS